ncbi:MAG: hypothetical protein ACHQ6U_10580 [Thermodesulfobacteriota bacterium]
MAWTEYIALGFPLITSIVITVFFPISLKDYFVEGEIKQLGHGLTPYKFKPRHYLYIFAAYITAAALLGLAQGYLLWDIARTPGMRFVLRFTDYFMYPFFPSGVMAVFLMLFLFSTLYVRRGEDDVRKFLLRAYDGWPLYKDIPRFRPVVLAAGILCTTANVWIYNVYIGITDNGFVYSTPWELKSEALPFNDVAFYEIREIGQGEKDEMYTLKIFRNDLNGVMTKDFMMQSKKMLRIIDKIIETAGMVSGRYTDVVVIREGVDNSKFVWGTLADQLIRRQEN